MSKQKKYLLEVNGVGTIPEIIQNLKHLIMGLETDGIELVIEEKEKLDKSQVLYETTVMTVDISEIAE